MLQKLFLFSIFCIYSIVCQNILDAIKSDSRISQFSNYVSSNDILKEYFKNPFLTIFIPSDTAMNSSNLANVNKDELFKSHMFESKTLKNAGVLGTADNWTNYEKVQARKATFYYMPSINNLNRLFMYDKLFCNEAKVTVLNQINGTQVYHIIDRVFTNYQYKTFTGYLSNSNLKKSYAFWTKLRTYSETGSSINFNKAFINFKADFPGTILIPTDSAWNLLSQLDQDYLMNNMTALAQVLSRHYIPGNIHFVRGEEVKFKAGFSNQAAETDLFDGLITPDLQVSVQGFSARISQSNIPILYGVVHLIDDPLFKQISINDYLSGKNTVFKNKLDNLNMSQYLSGSHTLMVPDNAAIAPITDPEALKQALLNSFIPGNIRLNTTMGTVSTVGGLKVRLREINGDYYLDVLKSESENTLINSIPVKLLNQMVGPVMITQLGGIINNQSISCDNMFPMLNSSLYKSLVNINNVTLNVGNPYTLLVPTDLALSTYIAKQSLTVLGSPMIKYVLQRMIIANRLILKTRVTGKFKAATMNYAAMQEMINMATSDPNCTVSFYESEGSFNFGNGGYYCYSNFAQDESRFNLIYPVNFVLETPPNKNIKICVVPPCDVACHNVFNQLLLFVSSLLMAMVIRGQ